MQEIDESEILNEPASMIDGKRISRDWTLIDPDQCIECKKKYKPYNTRVLSCLWASEIGGNVYKEYSHKTGYCPDCAEKHNRQDRHEQSAWLNSVHKVGTTVRLGNIYDVYSDGALIERIKENRLV